jgi:hypothetical protein
VGEVGLDLVIGEDAGLLGGAHHERDVRAVDVGVDEAGAIAELDEGDGEIDGEGGFANAAFAGSDSDDGFDSGKRGG